MAGVYENPLIPQSGRQAEQPSLSAAQSFAQNQLALQDTANEQKAETAAGNAIAASQAAAQAPNPGSGDTANSNTSSDSSNTATTGAQTPASKFASGLTGSAAFKYQKLMNSYENAQLDTQIKHQTLLESISKMDKARQEQADAHINSSLEDQAPAAAMLGIDSTGNMKGKPTPEQLASASQYLDQNIQKEVESGQLTPQQAAQVRQRVTNPDGSLSPEKFAAVYQQTNAVKAGRDAQKQADEHAKSQQDILKSKQDITESQQRIIDDRVSAAGANKQVTPIQVEVDDPSSPTGKRTETHIAVTDKATGKTTDTGAVSAPKGAAGQGGGRDSVYTQRIINSSNEAVAAAKSVGKLSIDAEASGVFGGVIRDVSPLKITGENLANKLTPQNVQLYNTRMAGLARSLSTLETSGLAPSGALTHGLEDAITIKPGDTVGTRLDKQAEVRQIIDANIDAMLSKPNLGEAQKALLLKNKADIAEAIPITHDDVDVLLDPKNKRKSLADVMEATAGKSSDKKGDSGKPSLDDIFGNK